MQTLWCGHSIRKICYWWHCIAPRSFAILWTCDLSINRALWYAYNDFILAAALKTYERDPATPFLVQGSIDLTFLHSLPCPAVYDSGGLSTHFTERVNASFKLEVRWDWAQEILPTTVTFLLKILEGVIANQLIVYLGVNGLLPPLQSCVHTSKEPFCLTCMAQWTVLIITHCQFFDSVDHSILLQLLCFLWSDW